MNAEVADILFQKQEYSGKIGVWNWLTKPQLLGALNSTRSYDSFRHALTHLNLSMDARSHWFEQISTQQEEAYEKSRFTKNPQLKLTAALDLLKIKAYSHAIQAIDKPKYDEVATTAFNLYQSLRTKIDTYFDTPKSNAIQLKEECQKAIDKAKPILEVHRGYKQLFLDIINLLFAAVSWLKTGDWRLFKANTESMNIANQINEHVGKQITIEKNGEAP